MINIILCDDNKRDLEKIKDLVNKFMKRNKYEYNLYFYTDYNDDFMKLIKEKISFKIYILDIETPSRSGIDIAREIRLNDLESIIIFLTGHDELGRVILQNDLMFLSFLNKFDNLEKRINDVLHKAIDIVKRKNYIKIKDGNNTYIIDLMDILYISKDSFERRTIVKTDYTQYKVRKSLSEIKGMLDDRFCQTHRACIVNKKRISRIDYSNRIIYFDNNDNIDLLSNKYKKELTL